MCVFFTSEGYNNWLNDTILIRVGINNNDYFKLNTLKLVSAYLPKCIVVKSINTP